MMDISVPYLPQTWSLGQHEMSSGILLVVPRRSLRKWYSGTMALGGGGSGVWNIRGRENVW
jgi:hypothetical protein